jgi:hypothetical protein
MMSAMAMSSRSSSAGFQSADSWVAGMRAMGETMRLDVPDHLVAAPPRKGRRSDAGDNVRRRPGQVPVAGGARGRQGASQGHGATRKLTVVAMVRSARPERVRRRRIDGSGPQ